MIHNRHQRPLPVAPAAAAHLIDDMATPGGIWPGGWPALALDRPLAIGATGGHGPIRYTCVDYIPGRRVELTFAPDGPLVGEHALTLLPGPTPGTSVLRHDITARPRGAGHLLWPLVIRWLHDALVEDLLDNAERAVGHPPAHKARWSPWVRLLRRLKSR
ncbi:SRPBCC family protein [Actinokineospora diospyrosa]|uniref:Polyketide cyclase/dehydrase/lipid transport protein n=1 Tax=Actinokineospora diospyrosa TaxID=103728 RepID=A0ABT1IK76_9PSEU|nr:SRPBCC family protein [Actinokineospora diospyrosa]MCP2272916.1 hypothetical protein [Actinokineospora diospyrosa]